MDVCFYVQLAREGENLREIEGEKYSMDALVVGFLHRK